MTARSDGGEPASSESSSEQRLPGAPEVTATTVGRAATWATAGNLVAQISWFGSLLVLAALVPPSAFGLVAAGMVLVNTAILVVGSGTHGAIITTQKLTPAHLRQALAQTLGMAVLVSVVAAVGADAIVEVLVRDGDPVVLRWLLLTVALTAASIVPFALLEKRMRFRATASIRAGASMAASAVAVVAGILGAGVWALVGRQVLSAGLMAVLATFAARRLLPRPRDLIGPLRPPGDGSRHVARWFFVLTAMTLVIFSVDVIVVGRMAGAGELGLYSLAVTLAFAPLRQLSWQAGGVLMPAAAAMEDREQLKRSLVRALRFFGVVLLPFVVPSIIVAPWAIPVVFGDAWSGMVVPFQVLLPVGTAYALLNVIGEFLGGSGNVDLHARIHVVWAAALSGALIPLVGIAGIRGAAAAHAVVLVPVAAAYLVLGARRLGMPALALVQSLSDLLLLVVLQIVVGFALVAALEGPGAVDGAARVLAALGAGVVVLLMLARPRGPLHEARDVVAAVVRRV